jgi:hypothetical protein
MLRGAAGGGRRVQLGDDRPPPPVALASGTRIKALNVLLLYPREYVLFVDDFELARYQERR